MRRGRGQAQAHREWPEREQGHRGLQGQGQGQGRQGRLGRERVRSLHPDSQQLRRQLQMRQRRRKQEHRPWQEHHPSWQEHRP